MDHDRNHMKAIVLPWAATTLNLAGLIDVCRQMQQPNPAQSADEKNLQGLKHTAAVLDSIQRKPYLTGSVMHLGYLFVTWPEDMALVLANTRGLVHLYHDGIHNTSCVLVNGSVDQWVDVCRRACVKEADYVVRFVFNRVFRDMESRLPLSLLDGMSRWDFDDGTFLLEHK